MAPTIYASLGIEVPDDVVTPVIRRQAVARLYLEQQMKQKEIAEALGVSPATIVNDLDAMQDDLGIGVGGGKRLTPKQEEDYARVQAYMDEHPTASQGEAVKGTGVNRNSVQSWGKSVGWKWLGAGPPLAARKAGRKHPEQRAREDAEIARLAAAGKSAKEVRELLKISAASVSQWARLNNHEWPRAGVAYVEEYERDTRPLYQRSQELSSLRRIISQVDILAEDNGRMHFAHHVRAARAAGDREWEAEQRQRLTYAVNYLLDMVKVLNDPEYLALLCTGWHGRDDHPEQRIDGSRPTLMPVAG